MKYVIVVTVASSGFGRMAANALAAAGHIVYASMRETKGRNAPQVREVQDYAKEHGIDLRAIELDVSSQESTDQAIAAIVRDHDRLDVVLHNAGHMVYGPTEAFTPEQLAALYDINVLSTQRVNRAALPQLREQGRGLVIWVSSSSARGGTPPYLSPYFAAKAAMDSLALSYAAELARWGIETSIIGFALARTEGQCITRPRHGRLRTARLARCRSSEGPLTEPAAAAQPLAAGTGLHAPHLPFAITVRIGSIARIGGHSHGISARAKWLFCHRPANTPLLALKIGNVIHVPPTLCQLL